MYGFDASSGGAEALSSSTVCNWALHFPPCRIARGNPPFAWPLLFLIGSVQSFRPRFREWMMKGG